MKSEHTKDFLPQELTALQDSVAIMTDSVLAEFRNSFDPDKMGFSGEEGVVE